MKKSSMIVYLFAIGSLQSFAQSNCPNSDFSEGSFNHWQGFYGNFYYPAQYSGFVPNRHVINSLPAYIDPYTCNGLSTIPLEETHSARLGNEQIGAEAEQLRYSLTVTPETNLFIYKYAVVLEDPGHVPEHQPSFTIRVIDDNGILIDPLCGYYYVYAQQGLPGWSTCNEVVWRNWTTVGLNLNPYMNETITIEFTTRDCEQTGHFGYAYLSAECGQLNLQVNYCPQDYLAVMTAPSGFTYLWNTGETTQSIEIDNPEAGTEYDCELTAVNGCQVTIYATLFPTIIEADFYYYSTCMDMPVYFYDTSSVNQNEVVDWKWDFGDGTIEEHNPAPVHNFTDIGPHNVRLISFSTDGCSDTVVKPIILFSEPVSDFTYTPQCQDELVPFQNLTTIFQGEVASWTWDFGDGSAPLSNVQNPEHIYENSGTYAVSLISVSSESCSDTVVKPVIVYSLPQNDFYQNGILVTNDSLVLCPLDSVVFLSAGEEGFVYYWTKGSDPNWFSNEQIIALSNPGMSTFVESYSVSVTNEYGCISGNTAYVLWDFIGCLGIESYYSTFINVYPNPATETLYIHSNTQTSNLKIELINIYGKTVYHEIIKDNSTERLSVDIGRLPNGVYLLRISCEEFQEVLKILHR